MKHYTPQNLKKNLLFKWLPLTITLLPTTTQATDPINLPNFQIDQTEVTVAQFTTHAKRENIETQAEQEGGGFEWGAGWQRRTGWNYKNPTGTHAKPNEPAVHISWEEAKDFCESINGRLPTKQEWISAAYTEQRDKPTDGFIQDTTYDYPVGSQPDGMNNNRSHHVPVGTTTRGVNGLYDMGANVWEWLLDRDDDQALTAGGSWWYGAEKTRVDGLQWKPFDFYAVYVGFRCVY